MEVKTTTIDLEAYELLRRQKRPGQAFSAVVKERFGNRSTGRTLRTVLAELAVLPSTLDATDALVEEARLRDAHCSGSRLTTPGMRS